MPAAYTVYGREEIMSGGEVKLLWTPLPPKGGGWPPPCDICHIKQKTKGSCQSNIRSSNTCSSGAVTNVTERMFVRTNVRSSNVCSPVQTCVREHTFASGNRRSPVGVTYVTPTFPPDVNRARRMADR